MDAFEQNIRLGRGVNILGYDPIWRSRSQGRIQSRHFPMIRAAGFNHVRVNLHPFAFMGAGPDFSLSPDWLATLDWVLDQCQAAGLLAILDMHEFNAMAQDPLGLKAQFLAFWTQLSRRYRDAPEQVLFEILNEPHSQLSPALWNDFLLEPLALLRESNPGRTLILGPAFWNGIDHLGELQLPQDDRNIIVTVHYYHPMPFTHQGAAWAPEYHHLSGIPWLGTEDEVARLAGDLGGVQAWADRQHRPIYLGEFGAYDRADMASRARYTAAVARCAEGFGWSWGYWQFDSDFVVYDLDREAWVEPIRDALIPG